MGIESMAREQGVDLDAMELKVDANVAIGIIGRQGLGKVRHLDLNYLWLQAAVRGKQVVLRKVQSGDNMADIGTKVLDRDTIQTDWTCRVWGLLVERVCERTPSHPHLRRAADHLEQQEEPHCKPSWKGNAHAPSCDACSGKPVKRGRQQRLRAKAM